MIELVVVAAAAAAAVAVEEEEAAVAAEAGAELDVEAIVCTEDPLYGAHSNRAHCNGGAFDQDDGAR